MLKLINWGGIALAISFLFGCKLKGQSPEILSLSRTYDYPTKSGVIIPTLLINPSDIERPPDSLPNAFQSYQYVKLTTLNLIPSDPYLSSFYRQGNNLAPRPLLFRLLNRDSVLVILDADGDADFFEERFDTIATNTSVLLLKSLILTSGDQSCHMTLPLLIRIEYEKGAFRGMEIQNYLQYELCKPLAGDTLKVDIHTHYYLMGCYYHDPDLPADSLSMFQMNEPFRFKNAWYKLSDLDLCANTVQFARLKGDKIMGFQEGQYLDMALLQRLTDKNLMPGGQGVDWAQKKYFLLHFWGEWCGPCVAELPEVRTLDESLAAGSVQMIHYPWVFKKTLLNRTQDCIKDNSLSLRQSYCIVGDCSPEDNEKEQCNVASLVHIRPLPQFILIDAKGKILFRGNKGVEQAAQKLKDLGLY